MSESRRFSSNNPFRDVEGNSSNSGNASLQRRNTSGTSSKRAIRPVSNLPVDDAFDYSGYQFDTESFVTADEDRSSITQTPQLQQSEYQTPQLQHSEYQSPQQHSNYQTPQLQSGFQFDSGSSNTVGKHRYGDLSKTARDSNGLSPTGNSNSLSPGNNASSRQNRHISFVEPLSPSGNGSTVDSPRQVSASFSNTSIASSKLGGVEEQQQPTSPRKLDIQQEEMQFDDDAEQNYQQHGDLDNSVMKRHRWGTQRHKKGRPAPKRSKSLFRRVSVSRKASSVSKDSSNTTNNHNNHNNHNNNVENNHASDQEDEDSPTGQQRRIYFNMPLPGDMINEENGLPLVNYPRNKIRTTKYTPLSFFPKNLFYQFQNIANIYFIFVVILGVCFLFFFFYLYVITTTNKNRLSQSLV